MLQMGLEGFGNNLERRGSTCYLFSTYCPLSAIFSGHAAQTGLEFSVHTKLLPHAGTGQAASRACITKLRLKPQPIMSAATDPALYRLQVDDKILDARLELEDAAIVLHSSGGAKAGRAINPDYASALRRLLSRLAVAGLHIRGVWVDSNRVQHLPPHERLILTQAERDLAPEAQFRQMTAAMEAVGQAPGARVKGNRRKRIRLELEEQPSQAQLAALLGAVPASENAQATHGLTIADLQKVTAAHLFYAVERLQAGQATHVVGALTPYEVLLDDGTRWPPEALFRVAIMEALGRDVGPQAWTVSAIAQCVHQLQEDGYTIVARGQARPSTLLTPSPEDAAWTEGRVALVTHLRRERASGLAQAKKADFIQRHGHLQCELCRMVPSEHYGEHGDACIEVHHHAVHVKDMAGEHRTSLADLLCLCANCHRVEHRRLKAALLAGS